MAAITPRRSSRIPHNHTPKMSERKKGLFQGSCEPQKESLTTHRQLPVVDSESDSEDCGLGIIANSDSSSGDDHSLPSTPERMQWHATRSETRRLKENYDLKSFIKSPFTLTKYQTRYSCPETKCGSLSTPATPHLQHHPGTPSSTHSCASAHTTSSHSSRARKSLASLIADTESCSSSLKDLNFDTDSGTDSKENTPTKSVRRSSRKSKNSFKGVLIEQKKNSPFQNTLSPMKNAVVCLTKMDMTGFISPSQILKTPNTIDVVDSPPKLSHSRRSQIEIEESPESNCDSEKSYKRLRNNSVTESGPISKHPRLENAPKARLSLFNCDKLKEILSAKSFYGKTNPELNTNVTAKLVNAIEVTTNKHKSFTHSHSSRRKRKPGQINMGVRHKIRKPKHKKMTLKHNMNKSYSGLNSSTISSSKLNNSTLSNMSVNTSILSQNSTQDLANEKADPFDKEKQTIEDILSQWEEEEIPESELRSKPELPCFSNSVIEETKQIFQPITAVPVDVITTIPQDDAVIVELGSKNEMNVTVPQNTQIGVTVPQISMTVIQNMDTQNVNLSQIVTNVPQIDTTVAQMNIDTSQLVMTQKGTIETQIGTTVSQTNMDTSQTNTIVSQNIATETHMGTTVSQTNEQLTTEQLKSVLIGSNDIVMNEPSHEDVHGVPKTGQFLPVEGGYIVVEENGLTVQEDLPDLDEIDRELRMLDEQILKMAESNNINAKAVLASTETGIPVVVKDVTPASPGNQTKTDKTTKLFPIFSNPNPGVSTPKSKGEKSSKKSILKSGLDQYVIDAGQKKFGATQCTECGTIYQIGDPQDEHDHLVHHNAIDVLRFNGWKDECVIEKGDNWRIIRVRGGDQNWRRVETLLQRVVHPQLGYEGPLANKNVHSMTAFLYIEKKQIIGCVIAETKTKAYKLIPGEPDCCSVEDYPVKCGISRLWTHINHRRRGVCERLVESARAAFLYGEALRKEHLAFSAPTQHGKAFATKYCGTENFYVYLD